MNRKQRFKEVLAWFEANRPIAESELHFHSPYQLIVAVILSAQCTDKRVNLTTPAFYERFPDIPALAAATPEEVYPLIRSISYPNSKAAHLVAMARKVRRQDALCRGTRPGSRHPRSPAPQGPPLAHPPRPS